MQENNCFLLFMWNISRIHRTCESQYLIVKLISCATAAVAIKGNDKCIYVCMFITLFVCLRSRCRWRESFNFIYISVSIFPLFSALAVGHMIYYFIAALEKTWLKIYLSRDLSHLNKTRSSLSLAVAVFVKVVICDLILPNSRRNQTLVQTVMRIGTLSGQFSECA